MCAERLFYPYAHSVDLKKQADEAYMLRFLELRGAAFAQVEAGPTSGNLVLKLRECFAHIVSTTPDSGKRQLTHLSWDHAESPLLDGSGP
jgi:hypothetical protein